MSINDLKELLAKGDPSFWPRLAECSRQTSAFEELIALSTLRKKALKKGLSGGATSAEPLRLAIIGGYSFYPLHELLEHLLHTHGIPCELFVGEYDNYIAEISDNASGLHQFQPQAVFIMPPAYRCRYSGQLTDDRALPEAEANAAVTHLLNLCATVHERTKAEVILCNFMLPARHDLGAYRRRTLGSDWSFRNRVNLELGLKAPAFIHICDLEFLAHRRGGLAVADDRAWFESKQPGSPAFLVDVSREVVHLISALRISPKKVLVLDLDDTLWGGVIAEDGLEGIELGDTSPRGEAFKTFQLYIKSLKLRGVLLAVCSKNDYAVAAEPFEKHPECVLRLEDFVSFKANWEPKPDNLRQMAVDLNLGLDSFVFVDDNPAEIEIVRQYAPEVTTLLLGPDPAEYLGLLQDCRLFEPHQITHDDQQRTDQYQSNRSREALLHSATDMDSYLESLGMEAVFSEFTPLDAPRLAQLINKSNQFNLTTRRRTEAEVRALIGDGSFVCFSVRLKDRFGDHGLISVVIGEQRGTTLHIDTWLMSCRVLKRQVEEEALNELIRLTRLKRCTKLLGAYLPTAKNGMVRDLYSQLGFQPVSKKTDHSDYELVIQSVTPRSTKIRIARRTYEPN